MIKKFDFDKVLVSPHRRTIQTAVKILKSHPQLEKGFTFALYNMAKEIVNNASDMPASREELLSFIEDVKSNNPKFIFDLSLMPSESPNTWHIQILQNEGLKAPLLEKINQLSGGDAKISNVHQTMMDKYR